MLVGTVAYLPPEQALGRSCRRALGPLLARRDALRAAHRRAAVPRRRRRRDHRPAPERTARWRRRATGRRSSPALDASSCGCSRRRPTSGRRALPRRGGRSRRPRRLRRTTMGRDGEAPTTRSRRSPAASSSAATPSSARRAALLEDALGGQGRLLLLSGDPGIGKTRTAEQLATYARVRGARVYWGRCYETKGQPPYWPWSEAIRSYVLEADPVGLRWQLGARAADIARIVPELAERLDIEAPDAIETEQARFRLFDSLAAFLADASKARPTMIVLDDLHWADEPSLHLLSFVARRLADTGLLIVGTYRDVELGRHHHLAETLEDLAGVDGARRVSLRGLAPRAIADYIELTAGRRSPARRPRSGDRRSDRRQPVLHRRGRSADGGRGSPRRVGRAPGGADPPGRAPGRRPSPRPALGGRQRGAADRRDLRARLPGGGDRGGLRATGRPRSARRSPRRSTSRLVERPATEGQYSFSHALVRETLQAEIPAARRVRLHGLIAEALERHADPDARPPPRRARPPLHRGGAARRGRSGDRLRNPRRGQGRAALRPRGRGQPLREGARDA